MTTAEAIRHIRKRRGQTQAEFAQVLRCRQNTVSGYERGHLAPSPFVLMLLLDMADPEEERALAGQLEDYSRRGVSGLSVERFRGTAKPLLGEIQLSWELMSLVPASKRADFGLFIPAVAHIIESCPTMDPSIPEILQLWAAHHEKPPVAGWLRDMLGFLRSVLWVNKSL